MSRTPLWIAPLAAALILAAPSLALPLEAQERPFGTLREQHDVQHEWLRLRLERVLPRLMREHEVDMWIIPSREYNEDPVFRALVAPTTFAARRRTIYVFCDEGPEVGVRRIAIGGTDQGGLYEVVREPEAEVDARGRAQEPYGFDQWRLLTPIVEACDPDRIQVNLSYNFAFSDGITAGELEQLRVALGPVYRHRIVHRELLPLQYIEERLPEMLPIYREMMAWVHETIATAFSNEVITPGETRTQDVVWWLRQRVNDAGLGSWFQPSVSVQRRGGVDEANPVIQPGDVLHTDFGIVAYGLATDTQHMGYVLDEGESEVPEGLRAALRNSNRFQDILLEEMEPGRTGNEVLGIVLERMRAEGLDGTMYTHPIGDHGHGAGPLIGLWDRQEWVQGMDLVPIRPNTWFSTELQVTTPVPEWDGQPVRMAQEEEAYLDEEGNRHWVLRRQEEFHIVRSPAGPSSELEGRTPVSPEHEAIAFLVGEWRTVSEFPDGRRAEGNLRYRWILDGKWMQVTFVGEAPGGEVWETHAMQRWNPDEGRYESYVFRNGGPPLRYTGGVPEPGRYRIRAVREDGTTVGIDYRATEDGGVYQENWIEENGERRVTLRTTYLRVSERLPSEEVPGLGLAPGSP